MGVEEVCRLSTSQDLLEQVAVNKDLYTHHVLSLLHTSNATATTTATTATTATTDRQGAKVLTDFKGQNRYEIIIIFYVGTSKWCSFLLFSNLFFNSNDNTIIN